MFELKSIADLKEAPYNPREISERNLESLKTSLDEFGDLSGIVWNKRTGHIVCGHQRIKALKNAYNHLEVKKDGENYFLWNGDLEKFSIRVVDWDDVREKAANIAANSPTVSGVFTPDIVELSAEVMSGMPDIFDKLNFSSLNGELEDEEDGRERGEGPSIPEMELQPYEHYDYVVVLCRDTHEWEWLVEKLKIKRVNASVIKGQKKIGLGRAISATRLREIMES